MQTTHEKIPVEKLYHPKQKTFGLNTNIEKLMAYYAVQDRPPSNGTTAAQGFSFFIPHRHPLRLSMKKCVPKQFAITNFCPAKQNPRASAIVDSLNNNKDKTDLPTQHDWRLFHTKANGVCAVFEIPHHIYESSILRVGEVLTKQHRQKLRAAKLFCEQYADINHGKQNNTLLPLAKFQIVGTNVERDEQQVIRIIVPIPSHMEPEDLEPFYQAHQFNWLRYSSNWATVALPLDANLDNPESIKQHQGETATNEEITGVSMHLLEITSSNVTQTQRKQQPTDPAITDERDNLIDRLCREALVAHNFEFTDISKVREIKFLTASLQSTPVVMQSQLGMIVKLSNGPKDQYEKRLQIVSDCIQSAQVAAMLPRRTGSSWSIKAGMIVLTFDQLYDGEQQKFDRIMKKYPRKVFLKDKQLIILNKQLQQSEVIDIGNIITNQQQAVTLTSKTL